MRNDNIYMWCALTLKFKINGWGMSHKAPLYSELSNTSSSHFRPRGTLIRCAHCTNYTLLVVVSRLHSAYSTTVVRTIIYIYITDVTHICQWYSTEVVVEHQNCNPSSDMWYFAELQTAWWRFDHVQIPSWIDTARLQTPRCLVRCQVVRRVGRCNW